MKPVHDLVVGIMAMGVGCLLILGAALQAPLLMQLGKSRLLVAAIGKTGARCVIAVIGVACIALGLLIAMGWRIHW